MISAASSDAYVWKIENFSSLSDETHCSGVFSACGVNWQLSVEPIGWQATYKSPKGPATFDGTQLVIGLSLYKGAEPLYIECSFSVLNLKDEKQTRKYDFEKEVHASQWVSGKVMCLKELLDPEKGFIIDDICYIKVNICAMKILRSVLGKPVVRLEPVPSWGKHGHLIQALIAKIKTILYSIEKTEILCSIETTAQSAGD